MNKVLELAMSSLNYASTDAEIKEAVRRAYEFYPRLENEYNDLLCAETERQIKAKRK